MVSSDLMSKDDYAPPFLHGCFDWRVNGLHWDHAPSIDLLSDSALKEDNSWGVLAAVVERARHGDHTHARQIERFFYQKEPFAIDRVSALVFADLAPISDLHLLEKALRSDDSDVRVSAAIASGFSGLLGLIPAMLSAWHRARSGVDHDSIGFAISELLEVDGGPIADVVGVFESPVPTGRSIPPGLQKAYARRAEERLDPPPFPALVDAAYNELKERLGPEGIVWHGASLSVLEVAEYFLREVRSASPGSFINLRHRFESLTGVDCREFYFAMKPQRLQMAATLEQFLQSDQAARYKPGVRYFFGHPIPD